jgi:hypothetical protein
VAAEAVVVVAALDVGAAEELVAAATARVGLPPSCPRITVAIPAARIAPMPIQTMAFCRRLRASDSRNG